jgi:hypothetical protein
MARAVCSSVPQSEAAPFLRKFRLGWGLVCHVSAISRGRSPGNCFPQLAPQLFVITGEAATCRSHSPPILMGWWSEQCNDFTEVLIAAGRARQHHKQCYGQHKERDHRSRSADVSEYIEGFHPLPERRCALRFKASAVTMWSFLYQGDDSPWDSKIGPWQFRDLRIIIKL